MQRKDQFKTFEEAFNNFQPQNNGWNYVKPYTDEQIENVFKPDDELTAEDLRVQADLFSVPPELLRSAFLTRGQ